MLSNSEAMHMYHRKSKCDINSLKLYLAAKWNPELPFSKINTDKMENIQRTLQLIKCSGQENKFIYSTRTSLQPQWQ